MHFPLRMRHLGACAVFCLAFLGVLFPIAVFSSEPQLPSSKQFEAASDALISHTTQLQDTIQTAIDGIQKSANFLEDFGRELRKHSTETKEKNAQLEHKSCMHEESLETMEKRVCSLSEQLKMDATKSIEDFKSAIRSDAHIKAIESMKADEGKLRVDVDMLKQYHQEMMKDFEALLRSHQEIETRLQTELKVFAKQAEEQGAKINRHVSKIVHQAFEKKLETLQKELNSYRLDFITLDQIIQDVAGQLQVKGAAVADLSLIFANSSFDLTRTEVLAQFNRRIRAHFIPIFVITDTDTKSDYLYSKYHTLPSTRLIELIVDELNILNMPEAYAVLKVRNISITAFTRYGYARKENMQTSDRQEANSEPNLSADNGGLEIPETADDFLKTLKVKRFDVAPQMFGKTFPIIPPTSKEILQMPHHTVFGYEFVKKFDSLRRSDIEESAGDLGQKALLLIYLGERGDVPTPDVTTNGSQLLAKYLFSTKLCAGYHPPPETRSLWEQMDIENRFVSRFLKRKDLFPGNLILVTSQQVAEMPKYPLTPIYRDDLMIIQLCLSRTRNGSGSYIVPQPMALTTLIRHLNLHSNRDAHGIVFSYANTKSSIFSRVDEPIINLHFRERSKPWMQMPLGNAISKKDLGYICCSSLIEVEREIKNMIKTQVLPALLSVKLERTVLIQISKESACLRI